MAHLRKPVVLPVGSPGSCLRDGAVISANSIGTGVAGQVSICAAEQLRLFDDSRIGVEATQADAGDINIQTGSLLHLRDSAITTSVAGGLGSGGNINIDPTFVLLDNGQIIANTFEGPRRQHQYRE